MRLVQVGAHEDGWAIPFERWGGVFDELTRRYRGTYITHSSFDWKMLAAEGVEIDTRRIRDTRIQAHVLWSTGTLALKPLCDQHVDSQASAGQQVLREAMRRAGWTWETVPCDFEPYWTYGALDAVLPWYLDRELWPRVQAEAPFSYELEVATQWVTAKMERYGARIDRDYCREKAARLRAYVNEADRWVRATYGCPAGSDDQLVRIFLQLGFDLTKRTETGARYALDKEVLAGIDHPLAATILARRRAGKLAGTYLEPYLKFAARDGRIHPNINTVGGTDKNPFEPGGGRGVRTTRMSMDEPNLQNVPKRGVTTKMCRNAFVPSEGNVWVKVDADQIEARILASLSEDPGLIQAFLDPGDFFVNLAIPVFSDPNFQKTDLRRQWLKNGVYAKIYGAGTSKLAATVGISEDVAHAFMQRFDGLYPRAAAYPGQLEAEARHHLDREGELYARSPLTNRRHVADRHRAFAITNYVIQGAAAEILKMKIVEADQAGLADYMVFPVHDEVNADVPIREQDEYVHALEEVLNDDSLLKVPLTWSAEVGPRWGECS